MYCIKCGGAMVGDGYGTIRHCEHADLGAMWDAPPDAGPIYCDYGEEPSAKVDIKDVMAANMADDPVGFLLETDAMVNHVCGYFSKEEQ